MSLELRVIAVPGIPEIQEGDDLGRVIACALEALQPLPNDIVAVAQKVVSKAEGRLVKLTDVEPSEQALELAGRVDKDPRMMELVLRESRELVRVKPGIVIVEDVRGLVMANAGIDRSNAGGSEAALLLPVDPDASARRIRLRIEARFGAPFGVIVTDSFGRAWRRGMVGTAIGASGIEALVDLRGRPDRAGRPLESSEMGAADALAAAAGLAMGEADEGTPCALIRGWTPVPGREGKGRLLRPKDEDLFR